MVVVMMMMMIYCCSVYASIVLMLLVRSVQCKNNNEIQLLTTSLSTTEYDGLKSLYDNTNGNSWEGSCNNWVFNNDYTVPCSSWYGVTCACTSSCTVTELILSACSLHGVLPTHIGLLTSIGYLSL